MHSIPLHYLFHTRPLVASLQPHACPCPPLPGPFPQPAPEAGGGREEVAGLVGELLAEKAPMLAEYLSLDLLPGAAQEQGPGSCPEAAPSGAGGGLCLASLPVLLDGYRPDLDRLPSFVVTLARDVEWGEEKECFRGLAQVGAAAGGGKKGIVNHPGCAVVRAGR